tara:strand:- start:1657 stop:2814 length:1158 start_codon:yes stop_codon:yes gene_type:complete
MKNLYFTQGTTGEQGLVQDLVDEQIKMYGLECYYIPRQIHEDKLWNDIYYSQFKDSYLIEMYLENFEQFGGNGDMLSKFGLRVTDEIQLTVSRRRWKDFVDVQTNKIVSGRPNDGDLIWFPLNETVFEIKYVENQKPFYQLGSLYTYTMTCEVFEYGDSIFDTGIPAVDNTEMESGVYPIILSVGGSGTFVQDERIDGTRYTATATGSTTGTQGVLGAITITNAGERYTTPPISYFYAPDGQLIGQGSTTLVDGKVDSVIPPSTPYIYADVTYDQIGQVDTITPWPANYPIVKIESSPGNVTAKVAEWDEDTRTLSVAYANGTFDTNELICGYDSNAKWSVASFDTLDMTDSFSENRQLEDEADDILDFTERNPFGEFGNFTGSF